MSYRPFIYIFLCFHFKISDWKPTLRFYYNHRCSSRKWQHAIFFVWWIDTVIRLRCYIVLINVFYFINIFLENNLYWFRWYHRKEGIFLCPGTKVVSTIRLFLFFYLHKVIAWVSLIIIYIISHSPFQTSGLKTTLCCYYNHHCSSNKWQI